MRGGARANAGKKRGSVTKATAFRQEMLARAAADGESPLEYLLKVMRESPDPAMKFEAAKAAAPYVHPRLAAVEHAGNAEKPMKFQVVSGVPRADADAQEHMSTAQARDALTH